jgi:hypothetical protein
MKLLTPARRTFAALLVVGSVSLMPAQVIFTNIGAETTYTPVVGYAINPSQEVAVQFTAQQSLFLDYADLELFRVSGAGSVEVALLANTASNAPGSVLESGFGISPTAGASAPVTHIEFSNSIFLSAGSIYWLAVTPGAAGGSSAWEHNGFATGRIVFDTGEPGFSDPWGIPTNALSQAGMRIVGVSAVPEPSTYGLIGSALLLAAVACRRHLRSQGRG